MIALGVGVAEAVHSDPLDHQAMMRELLAPVVSAAVLASGSGAGARVADELVCRPLDRHQLRLLGLAALALALPLLLEQGVLEVHQRFAVWAHLGNLVEQCRGESQSPESIGSQGPLQFFLEVFVVQWGFGSQRLAPVVVGDPLEESTDHRS